MYMVGTREKTPVLTNTLTLLLLPPPLPNKHPSLHIFSRAAARCITSLTWLGGFTVLIHVSSTGFSQYDIIPEVLDFHLHEVEDLVLASLGGDVVALLSQAAKHLASTRLRVFALVGAQRLGVRFARFGKLEVQTVVLAGSDLVTLHLCFALAGHVCLLSVVLQAPAQPAQQ